MTKSKGFIAYFPNNKRHQLSMFQFKINHNILYTNFFQGQHNRKWPLPSVWWKANAEPPFLSLQIHVSILGKFPIKVERKKNSQKINFKLKDIVYAYKLQSRKASWSLNWLSSGCKALHSYLNERRKWFSFLSWETDCFLRKLYCKTLQNFIFTPLQECTSLLDYYLTPCKSYNQFCVCFKRKTLVTV